MTSSTPRLRVNRRRVDRHPAVAQQVERLARAGHAAHLELAVDRCTSVR